MTSQTKRFIELSDILSLHFECAHCGAALLIPLSKEIFVKKLYACPHCGRQWIKRLEGGSIESTISDCVERLKALKEALSGGLYDGFCLTLEVKGEEEPPQDQLPQ